MIDLAGPGSPSDRAKGRTALIACGAYGRELLALKVKHGWDADILGISVLLHNRPDQIPVAVERRIREARENYDRIVVVYGDCGTSGQLDALLEREGWSGSPARIATRCTPAGCLTS